ncbi:MAG: hypothetical protein IJ549_00690 [Prevotella sp.]|nr:hypothetical protein [Prevotella sp.]
MEKTNLQVIPTIQEAIQIGIKNLPSLIAAAAMYVLTIWIPYINVGTTIAMQSIPGKLANGEIISPLFIFDEKYRHDFSAFFLLCGFIYMVTLVGFFFMIIPAIVISISMSLAIYILVDFDKSPTEAMKLSNQATSGHKWTIFGINLVMCVVVGILFFIAGLIGQIADIVDTILTLAVAICVIPFFLGADAVIYRELYLKTLEAPEVTVEEEEVV